MGRSKTSGSNFGGYQTGNDIYDKHFVDSSVINFVAAKIFNGEYFESSVYFGVIDIDNSANYLIRTGEQACHLNYEISTTRDVRVRIYSNPTITDDGNNVIPCNLNLNIPTPTDILTFNSLTISSVPTPIRDVLIAGGDAAGGSTGARGSGTGGPLLEGFEIIISPNTDILIDVENVSSSIAKISIEVGFFVEDASFFD